MLSVSAEVGGEQRIGDPIAVPVMVDHSPVPQALDRQCHRTAGQPHACKEALGLRMLDPFAPRNLLLPAKREFLVWNNPARRRRIGSPGSDSGDQRKR